MPEVLFDAVCQVTGSSAAFPGLPADWQRGIALPDESYALYFLDVFGRPDRIGACECERSSEATLGQALHLLNSNEIREEIGRTGARAERLALARMPRRWGTLPGALRPHALDIPDEVGPRGHRG